MQHVISDLSLLLTLACVGVAPLRAQIPDGATVVASFANGYNSNGGLFVVDSSGAAMAIQGLPTDLTYANCVLRDPRTGHLIAGHITGPSGTVWLYELSVQNLTATVVQRVNLGTARSNGTAAVNQTAWLPDGRLALTVNGIVAGATAGQKLWILDLATGTLTPPPLGAFLRQHPGNALAVSADGRYAYLAHSYILEVPLFGGGTPRMIANNTSPWFATSLFFDCSGALVAATTSWSPTNGANNGRVYRHVQSPTGTWSSMFTDYPAVKILNGAALDPATCELVLVTALWNPTQLGMATLFRIDSTGAVRTVSAGPPVGWGSPSSVGIDPNPELYGSATAAGSGFEMHWQYRPFPVGAPTLGNTGFQLAPQTSGGMVVLSTALIGVARAQPPLNMFGLQVLVTPGIAVTTNLVAGPSPTFPLPIPTDPNLVGLQLHGQAFGLDAALSPASTEGITFTVY